ncbi:MAG: hypothetical protein RL708_1029 [Bacteroidota bacterium]|jgi:hypothetical protein
MIPILLFQTDTMKVATLQTLNSIWILFWFWLAIIEFAIILFLLIREKKRNTNLAFSDLTKDIVKKSKTTTINMDNLMNSINSSGELYKELSRKCHPDKFVNMPNQKNAEEIFQEISKNKRNFEKLLSLKQRAMNELNLNF